MAGDLDPLQKASDQPRPGQFGIGLAAAFAPEVKGVGWAVAAAFAFADAAAGPCWSRGGLVSLLKVKNPKVWAWGWLPPSPLVMLRHLDPLLERAGTSGQGLFFRPPGKAPRQGPPRQASQAGGHLPTSFSQS